MRYLYIVSILPAVDDCWCAPSLKKQQDQCRTCPAVVRVSSKMYLASFGVNNIWCNNGGYTSFFRWQKYVLLLTLCTAVCCSMLPSTVVNTLTIDRYFIQPHFK